MEYMVEKPLRNFEFWSGAKNTADRLNEEQFAIVEHLLEQEQEERIAGGGEPMTETEINDFFWFDSDTIYEWAGVYPKYYEFTSKIGHVLYVKVADEDDDERFLKECSAYGIDDAEEVDEDSATCEEVYDWDMYDADEVFWELCTDNFIESYQIYAHWPAIIENDDFTGCTDEEEQQVRDFLNDEGVSEYMNTDEYNHVWDDHVSFGKPDFPKGGLPGDVVTLRIYSY